jgi:hypothetical protein
VVIDKQLATSTTTRTMIQLEDIVMKQRMSERMSEGMNILGKGGGIKNKNKCMLVNSHCSQAGGAIHKLTTYVHRSLTQTIKQNVYLLCQTQECKFCRGATFKLAGGSRQIPPNVSSCMQLSAIVRVCRHILIIKIKINVGICSENAHHKENTKKTYQKHM